MADVKRVYTFGDGKAEGKADMKNLLGGKGANLAEMNLIGVPVPAGFTITTEVCTEYNQNSQAVSWPELLVQFNIGLNKVIIDIIHTYIQRNTTRSCRTPIHVTVRIVNAEDA